MFHSQNTWGKVNQTLYTTVGVTHLCSLVGTGEKGVEISLENGKLQTLVLNK